MPNPNAAQTAAAKLLLAMSPSDRQSLLATTESEDLHAAERAKQHPVVANKFTQKEKAALKLYLLDGGGVKDDQYLRQIVIQAILDDDWQTVFQEMPHVVKNWINLRDPIVVASGGAVGIHGYGPTPNPADAPTLPLERKRNPNA